MNNEPKQLPEGHCIIGFSPDPAATWLVAYAGPCGDDGCDLEHARMYLIPMIGWLQVDVPIEPEGSVIEMRPAIMTAGGSVMDYLDVASEFKFLAVLRATDDVLAIARGIYHSKFKDDPPLISESGPSN